MLPGILLLEQNPTVEAASGEQLQWNRLQMNAMNSKCVNRGVDVLAAIVVFVPPLQNPTQIPIPLNSQECSDFWNRSQSYSKDSFFSFMIKAKIVKIGWTFALKLES